MTSKENYLKQTLWEDIENNPNAPKDRYKDLRIYKRKKFIVFSEAKQQLKSFLGNFMHRVSFK